MDLDVLVKQTEEASKITRSFLRHTPLEYSHWLSSLGKANVYVKWESEQVSGSAKARGAFNKLLCLHEDNAEKLKHGGAIVASTGNHGLACSQAMNILGIKGIVYVPEMAEEHKCKRMREFGATCERHGLTCGETESLARAYSKEHDIPYIPPSNDSQVLAGQGVIGCEIYKDLPSVDAVFVAVGGGGIICGVSTYLKSVKPDVKAVACETEQSPAMSESLKAGHIIEVPNKPTLSDGTAGGVEKGSITFDLCKRVVDDWVLVTEEEISKAIYDVMEHHHKIVEGSAGMAFAAYLKTMHQYEGKTVVIISCGSNISIERIKDIIKLHG